MTLTLTVTDNNGLKGTDSMSLIVTSDDSTDDSTDDGTDGGTDGGTDVVLMIVL